MRIGYHKSANPADFAAVILAAGLSSRMKEFKPLLPVDGRSALEGLAESVRGAGIEDMVVVTGHLRERLVPVLEKCRIPEARNEAYESGMFSSIQAGLDAARRAFSEKKGYLLMPVDCPLISIETMKTLMEAASGEGRTQPAGDCFFVPVFEGKKGHPLLIPASRLEEILAAEPAGGLKSVTDRNPEGMIRVPVTDEGCVLDMDTPEGYQEIQDFVSAGFRREKLSVLSGRKRVFLVRHGQTRQHEEPMFIGQYDVELNEEGCLQAKKQGEEIASAITGDVQASAGWVEGISVGREPLPPMENIYCSDLIRAKKTAEIIAAAIAGAHGDQGIRPKVIPMKELRELSLGEWDGRPVREIREQFPEEYERRGKDLFVFKTGNRMENFYDMQYRAVKGLRRILAGDFGKNIVIVAHSGVIRALENNLKGLRVDDEWEPLSKGSCRIWESPPTP